MQDGCCLEVRFVEAIKVSKVRVVSGVTQYFIFYSKFNIATNTVNKLEFFLIKIRDPTTGGFHG